MLGKKQYKYMVKKSNRIKHVKTLASSKSPKSSRYNLPLPSEEKIQQLVLLLEKQMQNEKKKNTYASVKQVLTILGAGTILSLSFIAPSALLIAKTFMDKKREDEYESWKQFNQSYLKRTIRRLQKTKLIEIKEHNGEEIVVLTKNGQRRILKYSLDELSIDTPKHWDGQWRLILYDVSDRHKGLRDLFRQTLRSLGFYQLQESVWIYPYPCEKQISFLREYYRVGNEVIYVIAKTLEDDTPYRIYFGV
jgi:DNA-binding PadR family transcriptional regulator